MAFFPSWPPGLFLPSVCGNLRGCMDASGRASLEGTSIPRERPGARAAPALNGWRQGQAASITGRGGKGHLLSRRALV